MSTSNEPAAAYIPPPPSLPVVQAPSSPLLKQVIVESNKVEAAEAKLEPDIVVNPNTAMNEWIIAVLKDAFRYPQRKHGWSILISAMAVPIVALVPILGGVAVLLIAGYLAAYYLDIIGTSTNGDILLPDWPVMTNFAEDILWPFLQVIAVSFISLSPTILYSLFQGEPATGGIFGGLLYLMSAAYFPMACIALVMADSLISALPHRVLPAIKRCLPEYWLPVIALVCIKVAIVLIGGLTILILPNFLSSVVMALIVFYGFIMQARITGLTCQRFRDRIQWG